MRLWTKLTIVEASCTVAAQEAESPPNIPRLKTNPRTFNSRIFNFSRSKTDMPFWELPKIHKTPHKKNNA